MMAKASKRRPWVVEMQPKALPDQWFATGAFGEKLIADAHKRLAQKNDRAALWRVRNITKDNP